MWLLVQQDRGAAFLYACVCGLVIGLVYDIFRIIRVVYAGGRIKLFFEDVLFCICAVVVFLVYSFNVTMGTIRLFSVIGALFGFFVYRFTIGALTVPAARLVKGVIKPPLIRLKRLIKGKIAGLYYRWYTSNFVNRSKNFAKHGFKL